MNRFTRRSGQSMVEFALVAPLLFAFLFGVVELGILFNVYVSLTNSAREAARAGSVYQYTGVPPTSTSAGAVAAIDAERSSYLDSVLDATLNPLIDDETLVTTITYSPATPLAGNAYRAGDTITAHLEHNHTLFFGLLGPQQISLSATSSMRIEMGSAK